MSGGADEELGAGCVLAITPTIGDEIITGTVITYDRAANLLLLCDGAGGVRILNAAFIKDFDLLRRAADPLDPARCYVDLAAARDREEAAIRAAESETERKGVGVTKEAQKIFDALSKTLPVRWDQTVIVVMNEVRVSNPYSSDNVSGGTPAANDRVKKVLDLVRGKLQASRGS